MTTTGNTIPAVMIPLAATSSSCCSYNRFATVVAPAFSAMVTVGTVATVWSFVRALLSSGAVRGTSIMAL